MPKGSLIVIGTGIKGVSHLTVEAMSAIENADEVFFLVADYVTLNWLLEKRNDAKSLFAHYEAGRIRAESYAGMVEEILDSVREGKSVVAAFYGHPGVFAAPSHVAIRKALREGYCAQMLPGISAEACLFADLGVDPGEEGWQAFEATRFLISENTIDLSSPTLFWQIGVIGDLGFSQGNTNASAFEQFKSKLLILYPPTHSVCVYEASEYAVLPPKITWITLDELAQHHLSGISTLFVPSLYEATIKHEAVDLISS